MAKFEYSPADSRCPSLFELVRPLGDLEDMLLEDYAGKTTLVRPLFESHSVGKGFVIKNYKDVLCRMESEGKIKMDPPSPPRRAGTIGKKVTIAFSRRET